MECDGKSPLDVTELRELYGDELLAALAREFLNSVPAQFDDVRVAVAEADAAALFQAAHRLKNAVSNLYSEPASQAAAKLEHMGRYEQLEGAHSALIVLETELSRLFEAVEALTGSRSANTSSEAVR